MKTQNAPHKWVKEIHAWANGIEIEQRYLPEESGWQGVDSLPVFNSPYWEFRIKPKESIVENGQFMHITDDGRGFVVYYTLDIEGEDHIANLELSDANSKLVAKGMMFRLNPLVRVGGETR